jgi:hypothetical protein
LLIDSDANALLFNKLNIALLALAHDRQDYLHLRLHATHGEWLRRLRQAPGLPVSVKAVLRSYSAFAFWQHWVRIDSHGVNPMALFQMPPPESGDHAFKNANYLYDDFLFERLSRMAKSGNISVEMIALHMPEEVSARLVQRMRATTLMIAVMDVSNAWMERNAWNEEYVGAGSFDRFYENLVSVVTDQSVLLFTSYARLQKEGTGRRDARFADVNDDLWRHGYHRYRYVGFTFDRLAKEWERVHTLSGVVRNYDDATWSRYGLDMNSGGFNPEFLFHR